MDKEEFDLESFPTSESALRMLGYVTQGFYDKSYIAKWLYQIMGLEYDEARKLVEELSYQMFPETATWGLMYHELKWQLPIRKNLTLEERRKLIYQKRDCKAPMTPYRMEKYLEEVTGFEVKVADANDLGEYGFLPPHPNVFKAYFLGEGTLNVKKVHEILNRLKQSHTTYGVSERIEIVLDNREVEQIILKNIHFDVRIPFWYIYDDSWLLDGTWLLDGSVILDPKRRYELVLGFESRQGTFSVLEKIKLISVKLGVQVNNSDLLCVKAKYNFGINFWDIFYFDNSWNLDGSVFLCEKRRYGLLFKMQNRSRNINQSEQIKIQNFGGKWEQHIRKKVVVSLFYHFAIDFWRITYLEGNFLLNGEQLLNANRCKSKAALALKTGMDMSDREKIDVIAETKSKDYWFCDGTLLLNGIRNLNSVYKKEVIE